MLKLKFSYDKLSDDLFLYSPKSKSKGSIEIGDIILDFNKENKLVGVQMINASKLLNDMVDKDPKAIRAVLENLHDCKMDVKKQGNTLMIKIFLLSKTDKLTPVIPVVDIMESSPAIAVDG